MFSNASSQIPQTGSDTEAVDFADIDGDGDWDAALADGGDGGNDQNRLWVNLGGSQSGTLGFFGDVTSTHAPVVSDQSRDVEFADIDGDGDPDLHASNESAFLNQACRFWINAGGVQGGSAGMYVDDTAARWLSLGSAGSSVVPSAVLAAGGFIDWSCDSDFADLDLDGDVDLLHSSHGAAMSGLVPSRLFLNDGTGHYAEFNPSGHSLVAVNIADGEPGLWCSGVQKNGTAKTTGQECDVNTLAIGVELVDLDGDFDVDTMLGNRESLPRLFRNRRADFGFLGRFLDKTGSDMPSGLSGSLHLEQDFADMDGDGDVDLVGINYSGLNDTSYVNDGGAFGSAALLPNSGNDDQDLEFCDFDGDGTLDVYIAAFASIDRVYHGNPGTTLPTFLLGTSSGVTQSSRSLMACARDVDLDGDADVLCAEDAGMSEILRKNNSVADTTAPYLPRVKPIANQTAAVAPLLALAHVYDNVSLRMLEANDTRVELSVDGCALPDIDAGVLATQVARAELPGNLAGNVSWRYVSSDPYGNTGVSTQLAYTSTPPAAFAFAYGAGSPGSLGVPTVHALSVPFAGSTLIVGGKNAPPSTLSWLALTTADAPSAPLSVPGLCNVNVLGTVLVLDAGATDAAGCATTSVAVPPGTPSGIAVYAQFLVLDGQGGDLLSSSAGLRIVTQ